MSPVEGALYLGVPNIYMNQACSGDEAKLGRFEPPFEQYAVALRPFKRILWSLVGSSRFTTPEERKEGIELICKTPTSSARTWMTSSWISQSMAFGPSSRLINSAKFGKR